MLLPLFLLAAHITGPGPGVRTGQPPQTGPTVTASKPASLPQAEARIVACYNELAAAMRDFSIAYNGSHVVDARKAARVRRAWEAFEAAERDYDRIERGAPGTPGTAYRGSR